MGAIKMQCDAEFAFEELPNELRDRILALLPLPNKLRNQRVAAKWREMLISSLTKETTIKLGTRSATPQAQSICDHNLSIRSIKLGLLLSINQNLHIKELELLGQGDSQSFRQLRDVLQRDALRRLVLRDYYSTNKKTLARNFTVLRNANLYLKELCIASFCSIEKLRGITKLVLHSRNVINGLKVSAR